MISERLEQRLEHHYPAIVSWYNDLQSFVQNQQINTIVVSGRSGLICKRIAEELFPDSVHIVHIPNELNQSIQQAGFKTDPEQVEQQLKTDYPQLFEDNCYPMFLDDHASNFSKSLLYGFNMQLMGIEKYKICPLFQPFSSLETIMNKIEGVKAVLEDNDHYRGINRYDLASKLVLNLFAESDFYSDTTAAITEIAEEVRHTQDPDSLIEQSIFIDLAKQASPQFRKAA